MSESIKHQLLVKQILAWINQEHGQNDGLSVLCDSGDVIAGRKPWIIGGFVPDIIAQTVPRSFYLIGEAKTASDLGTPHSMKQFAAYLDHLSCQEEGILVISTPFVAMAMARRMVKQVSKQTGAHHVTTKFLWG